MIFLDANATAPVRACAIRAVAAALDAGGNPASVHGLGRAARGRVEDAREAVAALVGVRAPAIVFTSGGTEALALALHEPGGAVLVSAVEHPAVRAAAPESEVIPVDASGIVDLRWLRERLARPPTPAVVAVMLANNETGVLQPVAEVAALAHAAGATVVCDAVQAAGKIAVDVETLGVDLVALSAHKLGGPQGVGALVARHPERLRPLLVGGGQERGLRGGTPNGPGIAGFGAAAAAVDLPAETERLTVLRRRLEDGIRAAAPWAVIWGEGAERLPNTTCVGLPGVSAQRQVMALDLAGVCVSAGSACSSGKVGPSPVLAAMGATAEQAREAIRVSLSWASTAADIDAFLAAWSPLAAKAERREAS